MATARGLSVGNWDRPATHSGYKARVTRHSSIWIEFVLSILMYYIEKFKLN